MLDGGCTCNVPSCPNCVGFEACRSASGSIGGSSCLGSRACFKFRSGASIADGSCQGDGACRLASATIGTGSCNAENACLNLGTSAAANTCNAKSICRGCPNAIEIEGACNSFATIPGDCTQCLPSSVGTGSCFDVNGDYVCWGLDMDPSSTTIGMNSCTEGLSCSATTLTNIGDNSCTGSGACYLITGNV